MGAGIGGGQGQADDGDGFGRAEVVIGEGGRVAGVAEVVAAEDAIEGPGGEGGGGGAVIDLVAHADLGRQCGRGDIGAGAGGGVGGVICRIGAPGGDAAYADALGRAGLLIGETRPAGSGRQAVAGQPVVRGGDGGSRG